MVAVSRHLRPYAWPQQHACQNDVSILGRPVSTTRRITHKSVAPHATRRNKGAVWTAGAMPRLQRQPPNIIWLRWLYLLRNAFAGCSTVAMPDVWQAIDLRWRTPDADFEGASQRGP
eukprot:100385-Chlamydomonas_euryale.AAC.19